MITDALDVWALRKSTIQWEELERILLNKSTQKVVSYFNFDRRHLFTPLLLWHKLAKYMTEQLLTQEQSGGQFRLR